MMVHIHDVDSTKWRLKSPARWRFREGAVKADPVYLSHDESEVVTPEEYMGDCDG